MSNRTGSVEPYRRVDGSTYFRARIRLADGFRERVNVPEKHSVPAGNLTARERAEQWAAAMQEREDETHELYDRRVARLAEEARRHDATKGETCDAYFARLSAAREAEGKRDVPNERRMWRRWVSPHVGPLPVASVTRDQIENVRDDLDAKVRERIKGGLGEGISGDTASNVWTVLRTTFKEAIASRDRTLRVRGDDPTHGHKPPLKTPAREKTFIYPAEAANLFACRDVPIEWREAYAVASYTYLRPEELQALTWRDVDTVAGTLSVSKATSGRTGKPKPLPKTRRAVREVPIHPALASLLARMREGAAEDAPVLPLLGEINDKHRAKLLREHLRVAGVTRPRLTANTPTLRPVDFRSMRDTGITWLALAGVPLQAMQRRAGHEVLETTLGYVKMAEDLTGKMGTPFAPLPSDLIGPTTGQVVSEPAKSPANRSGTRVSKAFRSSDSSEIITDSSEDDPSRVDVSARSDVAVGPSEKTSERAPATVDEAIILAIKLAAEEGDFERAAALIEIAKRSI